MLPLLRVAIVSLVAASWVVAAPRPAGAQETGAIPVPILQVAAGYTFMRDFSDELPEDVNFPSPSQCVGLNAAEKAQPAVAA